MAWVCVRRKNTATPARNEPPAIIRAMFSRATPAAAEIRQRPIEGEDADTDRNNVPLPGTHGLVLQYLKWAGFGVHSFTGLEVIIVFKCNLPRARTRCLIG